MKREYQNIVHFRKESPLDLVDGISIFIFIMGIVSLLTTILIIRFDFIQTWSLKCTIAIAFSLFLFIIWGLCVSWIKHKRNDFALAVDQNEQGIWINSALKFRTIYIPFSFLKPSYRNGVITFKYSKAFYYTKRGKIRLYSFGTERFRITSINKNQLNKFIHHFNSLVSNDKAIKIKKDSHLEKSTQETICIILLIIGFLLTVGCNHYNFTSKITNAINSKYLKKEELKFGHEYTTSKFYFTVNKGYRAESSNGKQVAIFNITLKAKKDYNDLSTYSLYLTTDKNILNDGEEYANNPLKSTSILMDGSLTPVVNQLNDSDYCEVGTSDEKKLTYNVVFDLQSSRKTNYFIYNDYNLQKTPDGTNSNRPSYILSFDPQELEVLK